MKELPSVRKEDGHTVRPYSEYELPAYGLEFYDLSKKGLSSRI